MAILSPLYRRFKRTPVVRKWARIFNGLDSERDTASGDRPEPGSVGQGWVASANQSYSRWQRRFTLARLKLATYVTVFIAFSFTWLEIGRSLIYKQPLSTANLMSYGAMVITNMGVYWLLKTPLGRRHPTWSFVGWSLSLQVIPQTVMVYLGGGRTWGTLTDVYGWVFAFFFQATLIPVCWPRHAFVQTLTILHDWGIHEFLNESLRVAPTQSRGGFVLDVFWICAICNLSVFLYERLQRNQFNTQSALTQTYRQLSEAESRAQSLVENALDGIFRSSPKGQYLSVNPAMARIHGYGSPEELMAKVQDIGTQVYTDPQRRSRFLELIAQQDQVVAFESQVRRADGSTAWVEENTRAVRNRLGEIIAFEGTMTDISLRKQAESEALRALETERELNHLKSQFLSTASHEFRTPLTTILASTEALEHYGDRWAPDKRQRTFNRIQSAVSYMTGLLDEVLTLERDSSGPLELSLTPVHLPHFCQDLVDELQLTVQSGQRLELRCRAQDFDTSTCVALDISLLRHILVNLLSNAIKYSPEGTPVKFEVVYGDREAIFRVQDSGIGIPPEDCDRLFESFHRASNVGTLPGTGLGLTIVKRSVTLHRGTIEVDSQVGEGTKFTVTLPTELGLGKSESSPTCDEG
ncbi:MAG: ATP-binding protein [Cyanobacteria bacterium P01_C01_bin.89]